MAHPTNRLRFSIRLRPSGLWILILPLLAACPPPPATQPTPSDDNNRIADAGNVDQRRPEIYVDSDPAHGRVHIVQPNETLWSLAERYYGHGKHWRKILVANRNRLRESEQLTVGMKLIIP